MTKQEYKDLVETLTVYSDAYYKENKSLISDFEFDLMMMECKKTEKEHPEWVASDAITQIVGSDLVSNDGNVTHHVPMLSIEDVFLKEDVVCWVEKVLHEHPDAIFSVEEKIDGTSATLRYQKNSDSGMDLVMVESRGDGYVGVNKTYLAPAVEDIRTSLNEAFDYLEIRGEVYMKHDNFNRYNEQMEEEGKKTAANARNLASGTFNLNDPEEAEKRGLNMFIFNVQDGPKDMMQSHIKALEYLNKKYGIPVVKYYKCHTAQEVLTAIDAIGESRGNLSYDIDGAVVKIDQIAYRDDFSSAAKYSTGHIAYKYPPEEKETVVTGIELQVGRTGRITPVAVMQPIHLCGTTVTHATLHNQDFINELGIDVGCSVAVFKSGEIIPKIKTVSKSTGTIYQIPDVCPVCGGHVKKEIDTVDYRCTNPSCKAQLFRNIIHFASRDCMNIKGLGKELIETLINAGYVSNYTDLYRLKEFRQELVNSGIIGRDKNTDNILQNIEATKENPPTTLLGSLGILNVGISTAKSLMKSFSSIDEIAAASVEELMQVDDIGETTAGNIVDFFHDSQTAKLYFELKEHGLKTYVPDNEKKEQTLTGMTICITGSLNHYKNRKELQNLLEERGAKVTGSVSSKTTVLINNDITSNSGKNRDAKKYGLPIMDEETFTNTYL